MSRAWIIDVLTDLQSFARANGMPLLAAHLDDTRALASEEIARAPVLDAKRGAADMHAAQSGIGKG